MTTSLPATVPAAVDQSIGPGLGGFLVTFFMAVALVVLVRSMVKHLRKVRYSPDPAERATRQIVIPSSTQVDPVASVPAEAAPHHPHAHPADVQHGDSHQFGASIADAGSSDGGATSDSGSSDSGGSDGGGSSD